MWRQAFLTILANIGTFFFGVSASWSSPSMRVIVENENYAFWVTKSQFGIVVAAMSFGAMLSCIPSGIVRHKYGTKRTMLIFSFPATIGAIFITLPQNILMLILGRFLIGVTVGCYMFLVQIYVGEISSPRNRASFLNFLHIFVHTGIIFTYTLGYFLSHRTMNIINGSIPLFYAIIFQLMVESPPYLASKERFDEAQEALNLLSKNHKEILIEDKKPQKSLRELLKIKSTRKAMIIMCIQFFFFQMSGTNAINFYAQKIFTEAGMRNIHPGISSIIYMSFLTFNSLSATIFARRFDRRLMIFTFNTLNSMCLGIIGAYYYLKSRNIIGEGAGYIPLIALCINSFAFAHGLACVTWGLLGELFTIEAKKVVAPLAAIVSHGLTALIVLSFPILIDVIGIGCIFLIFSTTTAIDIIFVYYFIPETRGKTIDEIQLALQG